MTRVVAIDGGKSSVRIAVRDADGLQPATTGPGVDHAAQPHASDTLRAALTDALAGWPPPRRARAVCIGLTGVFVPSPAAQAVATVVGELFDTEVVHVTGDMVTSYLGALGDRPGVVVAAGTGTTCLAVGPDGRTARVDGWGFLVGDDGSGYRIGRDGIAAALRAADGRGGSRMLLAAVTQRYGSVDAAIDAVYGAGHPAREIARFAPAVADAAHRGDTVAIGIWEQAGRDLAATVAAAAARVFGGDEAIAVAGTGGLFAVGGLLLDPFVAALGRLAPTARLQPAEGDALLGAARITDGIVGPLHAEILTTEVAA